MGAQSAKERLTQHMPVEHHFSQVDEPMSKSGMHFYGMGGLLYLYIGKFSCCKIFVL